MAKLTSALLVLALIAMSFLNAMEAAGRSLPGGGVGKDDDDDRNDKLYGISQFFWGLWPFGLLHPWHLFPFWWLRNVKATNPNPKASGYDHDSTISEAGNYAPTTAHSP